MKSDINQLKSYTMQSVAVKLRLTVSVHINLLTVNRHVLSVEVLNRAVVRVVI